MFLAVRIACANLESALPEGAERRPVWLEHRDSQELPTRWGWRRKHHAGRCWPGLQVKVSFFLAMESCRGLWGVFKQGKRKQFLIHFSLVGAN